MKTSGTTRRLVERIAGDPALVAILTRRAYGLTRRDLWPPAPRQRRGAER